MRKGASGFVSDRLIEARESRGLTQISLAELIDRTSSSVSRWESGKQRPDSTVIRSLSQSLNMPMGFFFQPTIDYGSSPMFFRTMASTTQSIRKRVKVRLRWAQSISTTLQKWIDLPGVDVPHFNIGNDHCSIRDQDIEVFAEKCRNAWGLGVGPISDLLLVLENAGVVTVKDEVGTAKMDGLSNWSAGDNRPYMLIARDKDTCVRSRMDAAHELGHLVLHRKLTGKILENIHSFKEIERQAFHFASAFLMPAESFSAEVWSPSLDTFYNLKERWKVSIGAMIMRCRKLDMLDENSSIRLWKHYNARGWRRGEPLDDTLECEQPRLLNRSVRLLINEGVLTRDQLLTAIRLHGSDVEMLCNLPRGYMTATPADVVELARLRSTNGRRRPDGTVIPFPGKQR